MVDPRWERAAIAAAAIPALALGVLAIVFVGGGGPVSARATLVDRSPQALLAAAHEGSVGQIATALAHGANPNWTSPYQLPEIAGGGTVEATPLLVAVARNDDDLVRALLGLGVDFRQPVNRQALCLAARLEFERLLAVFREAGLSPADAFCEVSAAAASAAVVP